MGTVIGVAVLLGIGWLILKVQNAFWKGANRHVLARGQHTEGQALTQEKLTIRSELDPDTLQAAIVRGIALPYNKPAALHAELFQGPVKPGGVQFCSGTKVATMFTAVMQAHPADAGGSVLTYQVESWTLSDGIVAGIPQLKYLRRRIEEEARKADPRVEVSVESGAQGRS